MVNWYSHSRMNVILFSLTLRDISLYPMMAKGLPLLYNRKNMVSGVLLTFMNGSINLNIPQ